MQLSAVQGVQRQAFQPMNFDEQKEEPISPALRTIAQQYDAKNAAPDLRGRAGRYEDTSSSQKCEQCAPKMYSERI